MSGTGTVAEGVLWTDGTVALHWRGEWPTTTVWESGIDAVVAVHGHHGSSVIRWLDAVPDDEGSMAPEQEVRTT